MIEYGRRYLRDRGVVATLQAVWRRYIYCSLDHVVLNSSRIDGAAADSLEEIRFRLAGPSDSNSIRRFDRARGVTPRPRTASAKVWRFLACDGETIVASRWYADELPPYSPISRVLALKSRQLWAGDTFCVPQYRSRGIARALGLFAQRHLATEGYTDFLGAISAANIPSLRMTLHDSTVICRIVYRRFLFHERLRVDELP
ncbi:MAG TPA: hypothetical protein VHZ49_02710 [Methylomirabilota bacterium]|nr:hypothetical protein [Methylomirabilota bacterium]